MKHRGVFLWNYNVCVLTIQVSTIQPNMLIIVRHMMREGGNVRVQLQVAWRALETGLCVSKNVPSLDWQSRLPSRDNNKSPITSLPGSQFHHPPLSNCHRPTSQSPVSIPFFSSISRQLSSSERLMRSFFTNFIWLPGYSWHNKVQRGYSIPLKKGGSNKKLRLTLQSDIFLVIRYRFPKVFHISNVRCLLNSFFFFNSLIVSAY